MSRSLFEEAIADAKQLREVAEQNAKKAIIEAVTPKIKEFIEQQLTGDGNLNESDDFLASSLFEGEAEDEEDVVIPPAKAKQTIKEEDDTVELSESALASLIELMNSKNSNEISDSDALREAFSKLTEREQNEIVKIAKGEARLSENAKAASKATLSKTSGENKMSRRMQELYELDLDELNEDKIVIDFGKDISLDKENPYTVLVTDSDEEEEDVTLEEPPEEEEEAPPEEAPPEDEEAQDEAYHDQDEDMVFELDEHSLRRALMQLREAKSKPKPNAKEMNLKKMPGPKAAADAFGGGTLKDMDEVVMNKFSKLKEAYENEVRKNRGLQQQLNEYRNGLETLREQLSELNLFNAKLLYVNKISQDNEVTPSQRRSVVEALDGAKNLREAKLLYKSITESLNKGNSASLNESARKLSPGQSSRPTSSGSSRLNESAELNRWATLAGLK